MFKHLTVWIIVAAGIGITGCADGPGTGPQNNEAMVTGTVYRLDGTPAAGAEVSMRLKNTLASIPMLSKEQSAGLQTVTGSAGEFAFDAVPDTGLYVIEATHGKGVLLIDSLKLYDRKGKVTLPPYTVKPSGAISGIVKNLSGENTGTTFVLAFGINRFVSVASDGTFCFPGLAEGVYCLRFITTGGDWGTADKNEIVVKAGDTLDIGSVELVYRDIPVPKNLAAKFDTVHQAVALVWEGASYQHELGYNVYRKNMDPPSSVYSKLNEHPLYCRSYTDTFPAADSTCEYCVTAQYTDSENVARYDTVFMPYGEGGEIHIDTQYTVMESLKSSAVTVRAVSGMKVDTVMTAKMPGSEDVWDRYVSDMASGPNGEIALSVHETVNNGSGAGYDVLHYILVYDDKLEIVNTLKAQIRGTCMWSRICIGKKGQVYVANVLPDGILCFDNNGILVDTIRNDGIDDNNLQCMVSTDEILYAATYAAGGQYEVMAFSESGEMLYSWVFDTFDKYCTMAAGDNNTLYVLRLDDESNGTIKKFNSDGLMLSEKMIPLTDGKLILTEDVSYPELTYDRTYKKLYVTTGNVISRFNKDFKLESTYKKSKYSRYHFQGIGSQQDGSFLAASSNHVFPVTILRFLPEDL